MRKCFLFLPVLLALVLAQSVEAAEIRLTGKVVATVTRPVMVPFNGVVDEVLVQPGTAVRQGAPLVRYHLQDEAARVLQREVITGAGTEREHGEMLHLQQELTDLSAQRSKARQLAASGLGSRQALSRLEANCDALSRRIELLRLSIEKSEKTFQARMRELEGYFGQPLDPKEELPQTLILTSPIDGYVLSLATGLNAGSLLAAQSTPIQVGQMDPVIITVPVYESDINSISVGDRAIVQIPSLAEREFEASVSEISWSSSDMSVSQPSYYSVELTVPNPQLELKPGFKAIVRFSK